MYAKQLVEQMATMGPVGWSVVGLMFVLMIWGLKKQYTEGNFPGTLVFGIGTLVMMSVVVMGAAIYLEKSRLSNSHCRSDTKVGIEQEAR